MKKICGILIAAGVLLAMVPIATMAYPSVESDQDAIAQDQVALQQNNGVKSQLSDEQQIDINTSSGYVKIHGIWGYAGDNVSDGHFGGRIKKVKNVVHFIGMWNTTCNASKEKIVGVLNRGYFNGNVITPDGSKYRITGLYKVDKEKHLLKLRWMTAGKSGWAVGKIITTDQ